MKRNKSECCQRCEHLRGQIHDRQNCPCHLAPVKKCEACEYEKSGGTKLSRGNHKCCELIAPKEEVRDWEKELGEILDWVRKYEVDWYTDNNILYNTTPLEKVKSFISSLLSTQQEKIREIVKGNKVIWKWSFMDDFQGEKIKFCDLCGYTENDPESSHVCEVHNQALDDILQTLIQK